MTSNDVGSFNLLASKQYSLVYTLVTNKYATLKELRDDYDVFEALALYDMCAINLYNRNEILKSNRINKNE